MKSELLGFNRYLIFKYGKKKFFSIDLVDVISNGLKVSKSEVKRVIDDGGLDMVIEYNKEIV